MTNQLQFEKSPYLLQHRHNPVHWLPWSQNAFATAQREDKPVFLSIGYSTCHWCHVMAHESFEDEAAAEVINRSFIPIKVDREERPDVDAVYMEACLAMTGSGGWPLTILMTPDQKPFWAGTYLPRESLLSLLIQAEQLWEKDRERLLAAGEELTTYLQREEAARPGTPNRILVNRAAAQYARTFDPDWGGFGAVPKFPMPHNLLFLMGYAQRSGVGSAQAMAEKTLAAMYRGGLFDHVGGGFSRYSTDRRWLVPHFEKMLYDNALLLFTYAEAYQRTQRPLYSMVARRTAEYVLRELEDADGGFFCGQDADSEGVEGKYYVFTPKELQTVLGTEKARAFCRRYHVTEQGNFEGKNIPNLIGQTAIDEDPDDMDDIRRQLRNYRLERTTLHKDDKILTAWNGLMIAGLAKAGLALDDPRYLAAAERAVARIGRHLTDGDGRLLARWRDGQGAFAGKLDDYAFYAWGLLELYGATLKLAHLTEALRLSELLLTFFLDREKGGLFPYPSDGEQLLTRTKETHDGAIPSGNSVAALVFSRLSRLTGEVRWKEISNLQFSYLAGAAQEHPSGHGFAMLALLEELWPSAELICTAKEIPAELTDLLRQNVHPALSVLVKTPDNQERLTALAPFTAEYPIPDHGAQYYLCKNGTCIRPTGSLSELIPLLQQAL